jgi:hypothetical protein
VARADRLAKKTGLSWVAVAIYVAVVVVAGAGLFTWDYLYRRRQEEAMRPPAPDVLAKNLVENIIGRGAVKEIKVDEVAGIVDVKWESATYPPAARSTIIGEVVSKNLDQVMAGLRVVKGDPLVYVRTTTGEVKLAASADRTGRVVQVLVKPGDKVVDNQAVVLIEPENKGDARKDLETEGLLASQMIMSQMQAIKTVNAKITYKDITLATVVGKRGEKNVIATYHPSLE